MTAMRRDAIENRQRLVDAADEVFARNGLDAPVDSIALAAGVGIGTLYRHFSTKEALIEHLVADLYERTLVAGRRALLKEDGTGLEEFLRHAIGSQQRSGGCLSRLWEVPRPESFLVEFDALIEELLAQAKAKGTIREECSATDVSLALWAARGVLEVSGDLSNAWERLLEIILAGLRPGAAPLDQPALTPGERAAIFRSRAPA
ncbi:MAG TPA: TetR/AcrR family transcriptional regulator [Acidimicrobiales bacterium]|jgi:AcrR family transcriptional regulator|nr:TetR/AcrR family transcriptional regulator [Acidimicrobiales bacterium]